MGRTTLIAVLGAIVVGSTGGGLAALHFTSPRSHRAQVAVGSAYPAGSAPLVGSATPAGSASPAGPGSAGSDAGQLGKPGPDTTLGSASSDNPRAVLATQMTAVLTRFAAWSRDHAGAPCPDLAALGLAARDPWGHDLELTCTDQPADQMLGALSDGPDRVRGTDDDIASWTLGPSVTTLVRGPRWKSAPAPIIAPSRRRPGAPTAVGHPSAASGRVPITVADRPQTPDSADHPAPPTPKPVPPSPDPTGDDIPARRSSR